MEMLRGGVAVSLLRDMADACPGFVVQFTPSPSRPVHSARRDGGRRGADVSDG